MQEELCLRLQSNAGSAARLGCLSGVVRVEAVAGLIESYLLFPLVSHSIVGAAQLEFTLPLTLVLIAVEYVLGVRIGSMGRLETLNMQRIRRPLDLPCLPDSLSRLILVKIEHPKKPHAFLAGIEGATNLQELRIIDYGKKAVLTLEGNMGALERVIAIYVMTRVIVLCDNLHTLDLCEVRSQLISKAPRLRILRAHAIEATVRIGGDVSALTYACLEHIHSRINVPANPWLEELILINVGEVDCGTFRPTSRLCTCAIRSGLFFLSKLKRPLFFTPWLVKLFLSKLKRPLFFGQS